MVYYRDYGSPSPEPRGEERDGHARPQ
jgi:hypothetical protein